MSDTVTALVSSMLTLDKLTDAELAALNNVVQSGNDPREVDGYETAKCLFTETRTADGVTYPTAHTVIREAFAYAVMKRLELS